MQERHELLVADGWAVRPADDEHVAIIFTAGPEKMGVALTNEMLSPFVGRIIQEAVRFGQTQSPRTEDRETIYANPIPVSAMAVARGRTETEAMLTIRFGNLTLSFAVEASMLHGICTDILPALRPVAPQRPQ